MGILSGIAKLVIWILRPLQFIFALSLVGILSYMIQQFRTFHYAPVAEIVVPEVFSVIALFTTFFSIIAIWCLGYTLQVVAAFYDFGIFVGYIASAALLGPNFKVHSEDNPLRNWLIYMRIVNGADARVTRSGSLVKALDALVILQIIFFFWTTLLSSYVAHKHGEKIREEEYEHERERRQRVREKGPARRSRSRSYDVERAAPRRERSRHHTR